MRWVRATCRLLPAFAAAQFLATGAVAADSGSLHLRCTNVVGGANWPVVLDLAGKTADSRPAEIGQDWIKWTDAKGGVYELERATGKLQLRGASTTGGYFLHYLCRPE
jgi:hypothetical protein